MAPPGALRGAGTSSAGAGSWTSISSETLLVGRRREAAGRRLVQRAERVPGRTWETRSEVVASDRGRELAWKVFGSYVRWGYTFAPVDGGTEVTGSWEFLPDGIAFFHERFPEGAEEQIAKRADAAQAAERPAR